jgi:hypothetical protein
MGEVALEDGAFKGEGRRWGWAALGEALAGARGGPAGGALGTLRVAARLAMRVEAGMCVWEDRVGRKGIRLWREGKKLIGMSPPN